MAEEDQDSESNDGRRSDQAVVPSDVIPEDVPDAVPDHVTNDAEVGYERLTFDVMRVEDAYDDVSVITYRRDADSMSANERQAFVNTVKYVHSRYDSIRDVETDDGQFVVRLDYHPERS